MKVLYLDQSGQLGGGEIALLPWLRLQRDNAQVVLFEDGPFRVRLEGENVSVQVVKIAGMQQIRRESSWLQAVSIFRALFGFRATLHDLAGHHDLLYANSMKALLVAALIRHRGQPLVWHLRDILSREHFSMPIRLVAVAVGNWCASAIISNSCATAAAFIQAGGRREKVSVVYDGVSSSRFETSAAATIRQLRSSLKSPEQLQIGVFSRLSHWKGQHIVLEAVSNIPGVHLLIVGDALFGETEYAASLRRRAEQQDLSGRVTFAGFREDVADLMQCVDLIVHSSTSAEPFGLVIVEAMLAGKPVIATRAGGAVEIIQSGESGILVNPGSATELHDAIIRLRNDPREASRLGRAARARAIQQFPLHAMFEGIGEVIERFNPLTTANSRENA